MFVLPPAIGFAGTKIGRDFPFQFQGTDSCRAVVRGIADERFSLFFEKYRESFAMKLPGTDPGSWSNQQIFLPGSAEVGSRLRRPCPCIGM